MIDKNYKLGANSSNFWVLTFLVQKQQKKLTLNKSLGVIYFHF